MNQKLKDGLITATISGVTVLSVSPSVVLQPTLFVHILTDLYEWCHYGGSYDYRTRTKLQTIRSSVALECLFVWGLSVFSWLIAHYTTISRLSYGCLLLLCGRLADIIGSKKMFIIGSAWFTIWFV